MRRLFVRRQMLLAVDGGWILRKRVAHEKCGIENFHGHKQVHLVIPICKRSAKHWDTENGGMGGAITYSSSINQRALNSRRLFFVIIVDLDTFSKQVFKCNVLTRASGSAVGF